ncbi:MAG: 50S ribosomal protein L18 [Thermoplasmata archaeon HGW-Thermoplasmata-1]|nr:MAG: 50S ribosomal protein L18 [Thermoplasmata archaeon HGW-Thermoplasmata-1]
MAHGPRFKVAFRRRREGRTDYRHRLRLLKSKMPRVVVRKSLKNIIVQFVEYVPEGDRILATATATELKPLGWESAASNTPSAYLTGLLAGKRAAKAGIDAGVLDLGLYAPVRGSKLFAALKGVLDAGIDVPHGDEVIPSEERIRGEHMGEDVAEMFKKVKTAIEGGVE